jgi:CheY-like chemotaxis protein
VVDYEQLVRLMVQLGLERNGFDVWVARNGREALQLYKEHRDRIDVVLLDVCMAGLDGPPTLDGLRGMNPKVLACFMTAYPAANDLASLRERGALCLITKPFLVDQLVNFLRQVLKDNPGEPVASDGPGRR